MQRITHTHTKQLHAETYGDRMEVRRRERKTHCTQDSFGPWSLTQVTDDYIGQFWLWILTGVTDDYIGQFLLWLLTRVTDDYIGVQGGGREERGEDNTVNSSCFGN